MASRWRRWNIKYTWKWSYSPGHRHFAYKLTTLKIFASTRKVWAITASIAGNCNSFVHSVISIGISISFRFRHIYSIDQHSVKPACCYTAAIGLFNHLFIFFCYQKFSWAFSFKIGFSIHRSLVYTCFVLHFVQYTRDAIWWIVPLSPNDDAPHTIACVRFIKIDFGLLSAHLHLLLIHSVFPHSLTHSLSHTFRYRNPPHRITRAIGPAQFEHSYGQRIHYSLFISIKSIRHPTLHQAFPS